MTATEATHPTRRLRIESCQPITSGTTSDGRTWQLFKVQARDRHGVPVDAELRSFDPLEPGLVEDFKVERRQHERYGTSYLLRRDRGRLGDRINRLEATSQDHEQRLAKLEAAPPY